MSDNHHENLKIFAFIGDSTDGIIEHLTTAGYPKVSQDDMVSQIHHLVDAGQHYIVTNQLTSFELYKEMRHAFPGEITLVAIVEKDKIPSYLEQKPETPQNWDDLEKYHEIDLFEQADEYLEISESPDQLYVQVDELLTQHDANL